MSLKSRIDGNYSLALYLFVENCHEVAGLGEKFQDPSSTGSRALLDGVRQRLRSENRRDPPNGLRPCMYELAQTRVREIIVLPVRRKSWPDPKLTR